MNDTPSELIAEITEAIDHALATPPALTEAQYEDVKRLRAEAIEHCHAGRAEEARACAELALNILREGAPSQE